MSTLSVCIKKAGKALNKDDADGIKALRDELVADGVDAQEAAIRAVLSYIDETEKQIRDLAGINYTRYLPDAPNYQAHIQGERGAEPVNKPKSAKIEAIDSEIDAAAAELAELLKPKPGTLNTGVDPQVLVVGAKLGALYIKKGIVKFVEWSQAIINKLNEMGVDAEQIKPHLKEIYAATQQTVSDEEFEQMDDARVVRSTDVSKMRVQQAPAAPKDPAPQEQTQGEKPTKAPKANTLAGFIYDNLSSINDNRALKSLVAKFRGVPASEITPSDMKEAQELVEVALVRQARETMRSSQNEREVFDKLVEQYNQQPNLNVRSSTSMENQAYSTPAPLAMIASQYAGIEVTTENVYEPTAGNGMLLIGASIENSSVNELNDDRAENLRSLGYKVSQRDATQFPPTAGFADAVIMNPPFGRLRDEKGNIRTVKTEDGYDISAIDHLIAARQLEAMKDDGRATLIIGAGKETGDIGKADRIFFNWLYGNYNVVEHFEVDGDLYRRQGAGWPVRVIVINGRQSSKAVSPRPGTIQRLGTWEEVYEHYDSTVDTAGQKPDAGREDGVGATVTPTTAPEAGITGSLDGGQTTRVDGQGGRSNANAGDRTGSVSGGTTSGQQPSQGGRNPSGQQPIGSGVPGGLGSAVGATEATTGGSTTTDTGKPTGLTGNQSSVATPPPKPVTGSTPTNEGSEYQTPYPVRSSGFNDAVLVPNNMAGALERALEMVEREIGKTVDEYLMEKLDYGTVEELHEAFMGLQVDAIAAAIYNIESKNKGIIIADQTGVGKGRQAAAIIRYAKKVGKIPIFVTVQDNLYTDMYDDLNEINETNINPFLINDNVEIKSKFGNVKSLKGAKRKEALDEIVATGELPKGHDMLFMTYHQIKSEGSRQRDVVSALRDNAIFVLDESHNVSGQRTMRKKVNGASVDKMTGAGFMFEAIKDIPVVYLSATYAKRAENMAVYYRTDLLDAVDSADDLISAVENGGVPMQQVMAAMLTESGQLFRRERSFEGISIPTTVDYVNGKRHREIADLVTGGLQSVMDADMVFQAVFFEIYKAEQQQQGGSASMAGNKASKSLDHARFSDIIHNYIRQMLLALKADTAADKAIEAWNNGSKAVIALENTMGSFLERFTTNNNIEIGDPVEADYRDVLLSALEGTRRIKMQNPNGDDIVIDISMGQLDPVTRAAYLEAEKAIKALPLGNLPLSPIDHMIQRITEAGISIKEMTGRKLRLDYSGSVPVLAKTVNNEPKDKRAKVDAFNDIDGGLDALILNVSGATGLSIHASEKFTDQRPRKMIVAQAMQDINILMQMLGRINRTGQVVLPEYEMLATDLPIEKRPAALTSRKMASLNANTSANDESDTSIDAPDILNKYGDKVVNSYLLDNLDIARWLDVSVTKEGKAPEADFAMKVTGRMARLPSALQEEMYEEIEKAYDQEIEYLTATGQNDLIAQTLDLDAKILESRIVYEGKSPTTVFGRNTTLHKVDAKYQGRPPTAEDVAAAIKKGKEGPSTEDVLKGKAADPAALEGLRKRLADRQAALVEHRNKGGIEERDKRKLDVLADAVSDADASIATYENIKRTTTDLIQQFTIGSRWRLDLTDEEVTGVVVGIKDSHKEGKGNPYSGSKTEITFMVNSGLRQVSLPLTKLTDEAGVVLAAKHGNGTEGLDRIFTKSATDRRETRYIATGNIIMGMASLEGGRIVNFTDSNGKAHQGIMMPKKFGSKGEFSAAGAQNLIALRDPAVVKRFLKETEVARLSGAGGVFNKSNAVRITKNQGSWVVQVPRAQKDPIGNAVRFDGRLREIIGDFYGSSTIMLAKFDESKLDQVVDRVMEITPLYALNSMKEDTLAAGATEASEAVQSFEGDAVATGKAAFRAGDRFVKEGLGLAKLKAAIKDINGTLSDDVVLLATQDDIPAVIKQEMAEQGLDFISGYYHRPTGKVYLVADAISSVKSAQVTLLHEMIGHKAMEDLFGAKFGAVLKEVYGARNRDKAIGEAYAWAEQNYPNANEATRAAEAIARFAEQNPKHSLVKKLFQAIREALRKLGFNVLFTSDDLVSMLNRAAKNQEKAAGSTEGLSRALFSHIAAAAKLTEEQVAEWRKAHKVRQRKGRVPQVQDAAKDLAAGKLSKGDYTDIVNRFMPIMPITEVPALTSTQDISAAVTPKARETILGVDAEIADGTRVASRLDIPAYDHYDTWVVTVHDGSKRGGKAVAYSGHAVMRNVEFVTNAKAALGIATGETAKAPFARIHGDWKDMTPETAHKMAQDAMQDPSWVQVGMNPFRHSFFYDKANGAPVVSADSVIQIGPLVLAKNVKYALATDKAFQIGTSDVYFSQARDTFEAAPEFYSGLTRAAESLKQEKGSPEQMLNALKKMQGVKEDELYWSGLQEYLGILANQGEKVTKEQILKYLDANGVRVETVTNSSVNVQKAIEDYGYEYEEESEGFTIVHPETGEIVEYEDLPQDLRRTIDQYFAADSEPKFARETLSGGENYREILLTLPDRDKRSGREALGKPIKLSPKEAEEQAGLYDPGNVVKEFLVYPNAGDANIAVLHNGEYDVQIYNNEKAFYNLEDAEKYLFDAYVRKEGLVTSSDYGRGHFGDVRNVLAHIRLKDRIGPNGERILFVEEIQSDWHQEGKKYGYDGPSVTYNIESRRAEAENELEEARPDALTAIDEMGIMNSMSVGAAFGEIARDNNWARTMGVFPDRQQLAAINRWREAALKEQELRREMMNRVDAVPDAPFKGNAWVELAVKKVLRLAAEGGYDRVAWTTGKQQADRYNLRKHINELRWEYNRNTDKVQLDFVRKDDFEPSDAGEHTLDELEKVIGKELAERIANDIKKKKAAQGMSDQAVKYARYMSQRTWPTEQEAVAYLLNKIDTDNAKEQVFKPVDRNIVDEFTFVKSGKGVKISQSGIGKAMAPSGEYSGINLEVGGEGLKSFYDQNLRNVFSKVGKKLDKAADVDVAQVVNGPQTLVSGHVSWFLDEDGNTVNNDGGLVDLDDVLTDIAIAGMEELDYGVIRENQIIDFTDFTESEVQQLRNIVKKYDGGVNVEKRDQKARADTSHFDAQGMNITPGMREAALATGQSLFRKESDQTDTPEFKKWFDGSKVVDKKGRPLVVYHGTDKIFSVFDGAKGGASTGAYSGTLGHFFTSRKSTAKYYSRGRNPNVESSTRAGNEPNVMPVYLNMKNPLIHDMKNKVYREKSFAEIIKKAKELGNDGVIFERAYDSGEYDRLDAVVKGKLFGESIYVVFASNQVKSADGNSGAFDRNNPDIMFRTAEESEQEDTPAFKNWFGDSKVVDGKGKPLRLYHHGTFGISDFVPEGPMHFGTEGAAWKRAHDRNQDMAAEEVETYFDEETERWHWATENDSSEDMGGEGYEDQIEAEVAGVEQAREWASENPDFDPDDIGATTEVYLNITNPKRVEDQVDERGWAKAVRDAIGEGHDGIVYTNKYEDKGSESWIAFYPHQVKSATDNVGDFDRSNPDILHSKADLSRREFLKKATAIAVGAALPRMVGAKTKTGKAIPLSEEASSTPLSEEVIARLKDNDLKGALSQLEKDGPKEIRTLARVIARHIPDSGIGVVIDATRKTGSHGMVRQNDDGGAVLTLYTAEGYTGDQVGTLLHESLHMAVMARYSSINRALKGNYRNLKMDEPGAREAMDQFIDLWREFQKEFKGAEGVAMQEALRYPDEFFVRALTDPEVQAAMAGREYKGRTLMERFKDWVKFSLFSFSREGTVPSWLDAALMGANDFVEAMGKDAPDFAFADNLMRAIGEQNKGRQRDSLHSRRGNRGNRGNNSGVSMSYTYTPGTPTPGQQQTGGTGGTGGGNGGNHPFFNGPSREDRNRIIREEHHGIWWKAKTYAKRQLLPGGLLPKKVFDAKIERDSELGATELDVKARVWALEYAFEKEYGHSYDKRTPAEEEMMDRALRGDLDTPLRENTKIALEAMRQYIDSYSDKYIEILQEDSMRLMEDLDENEQQDLLDRLETGELDGLSGRQARIAQKMLLLKTITDNVGEYVHRSYRAFDDPQWPRNIPDSVQNDARDYLIARYLEQNEDASEAQAEAAADRVIEDMVKKDTAFDSIEAFIKESTLGARDLSLLKRRKDIAPEIRALLGEYGDPRLNFAKTTTKMARLVFNDAFLKHVLSIGMGEFLFEDGTQPLGSWDKIASDGSKALEPLDGLRTTPEIHQAFKDALGKEQMADWFRFVVRLNGAVKFGKTVLSPTTAARNWMSAMFFALGNGHFNLLHIRKSIASMKSYFMHHGDGLEYLRKLKKMGVVYDTPYAGEMMRLLNDTDIADRLTGSQLGAKLGLEHWLHWAQRFYQFGDDFWKIVGYENEKRIQMEEYGLNEGDAEKAAAERIRNTYPTYSMVGRGISQLRRFPLAGTFVSFPAEIVRTSSHIVRYAVKDAKQSKALAARRLVGLALISGLAWAVQEMAKRALDMDDDEEEAVREQLPEWSKNSNLMFLSREDGNLRYLDLSFLDPYNYWKRPLTAIMRDEPVNDKVLSAMQEFTRPFFGEDIAFGAMMDVWTNKKDSGGRVYNQYDDLLSQTMDISNHLRKNLQPGAFTNMERILKAASGDVSVTGTEYTMGNEMAALAGFRVSTLDPKTSLKYRGYGIRDALSESTTMLSRKARDPNKVSDKALRETFDHVMDLKGEAYKEALNAIKAARRSGLDDSGIAAQLKAGGFSKRDTALLVRGDIPKWRPGVSYLRNSILAAKDTYGEDVAEEFKRRRGLIGRWSAEK